MQYEWAMHPMDFTSTCSQPGGILLRFLIGEKYTYTLLPSRKQP